MRFWLGLIMIALIGSVASFAGVRLQREASAESAPAHRVTSRSAPGDHPE